MRTPDYSPGCLSGAIYLCGLEPQLIKLEFIIYLPKLKVHAIEIKIIWAVSSAFYSDFIFITPASL